MKKEFFITASTEDQIDSIIEQLYTPGVIPEGTESSSLSRCVEVCDYMSSSSTTIKAFLTEEEANALKKCPGVVIVEERLDVQFEPNSQAGKKRQLTTVGQAFNSSSNTTPEQWGFGRCNSLSALPPFDMGFTYYYTGSGVDAIILDSGIVPGHPEWLDQNGQTRLQFLNWSLFAPVTADRNITVTVSASPGNPGQNSYFINGVEKDTVYVVKDRVGVPTARHPAGGFPVSYRTGVYDFNLVNTTSHPFFIGSAVNVPFDSRYVSNNGASTGTVSLTVWPNNNSLASAGQQDTMYYWCGVHPNMGGVIARTDYNCQSDRSLFYQDTDGHGTHCTGTVAGSSCGWAIDAQIFTMRINFLTSNGYGNYTEGLYLMYDLIERYHKYKKTVPGLSSRPSVMNNSYGYTCGTIDVIDQKVKQLTDNAIHFVHSAGNANRLIVTPIDDRMNTGVCNSREDSPAYPISNWTSHEDNPVITVGAIGGRTISSLIDAVAARAEYSQYGSGVSIYAPGSYIQSAYIGGVTYPGYPGYFLSKLSGTSMAGPNIAGILCTILERFPHFTPQQAKNFLMQCASINTLSSSGLAGNYGLGDPSINNPSRPPTTNLTVSKFPATSIATTTATELFAQYLSHCYINTSTIPLSTNNIFFSRVPYRYSTQFYLNSSTDLQFLSACP